MPRAVRGVGGGDVWPALRRSSEQRVRAGRVPSRGRLGVALVGWVSEEMVEHLAARVWHEL